MAVRILDASIFAMGNKFRSLVNAHSPASFHSLLLGTVMTTAALGVLALHVPSPIGIGDNMMFFSYHVGPFS